MNEKVKKFLAGVSRRLPVEVDHPTLGKVHLRELTLGQRLEMEREAGKEGAASRPAMLIAACAFDDEGNRLFIYGNAAAIDALPASEVTTLSLPAAALNALTPEAEAQATKN